MLMNVANTTHPVGSGAWRPGVFRVHNVKGSREDHERRWAKEAKDYNKSRSLSQKILRRDVATTENMMRDEAVTDNAAFDRGDMGFLYFQRLGETILAIAGIEERHFPTKDALKAALEQSPELQGVSSYHDVRMRACRAVDQAS